MWRGEVHMSTKVARYDKLISLYEMVKRYLVHSPPDNFIKEQRGDVAPPSCSIPPDTLTDEC